MVPHMVAEILLSAYKIPRHTKTFGVTCRSLKTNVAFLACLFMTGRSCLIRRLSLLTISSLSLLEHPISVLILRKEFGWCHILIFFPSSSGARKYNRQNFYPTFYLTLYGCCLLNSITHLMLDDKLCGV